MLASLALVVVFAASTWWAKETPALDLAQPWQDDPYDVLVSLDFAVLPFLAVMIGWRALLCRRHSTLPARRVIDVLRACAVAVGACLATEMGEWASVALGLHRPQWTAQTGWQVVALVVFTAATVGIGVHVVSAGRRVRLVAAPGASPDWLADLATLGSLAARRLGGGGAIRIAVHLLDTQVSGRVRRHPVAAAAVLAGLLALPFTVAKIVLEGYPPLLVALSFALPAAVLFAFLVLAGWALRLVTPTWPGVPGWLPVLVVACLTGPAAFAFHDSLPAFDSQIGLNALLFGGASIGAAVAAIARLVVPRARA